MQLWQRGVLEGSIGAVGFCAGTFAVVTWGGVAACGTLDGLNEGDATDVAGDLYELGLALALNCGAFGTFALKLGPLGIGAFGIALTVVC